MKDWKDQLRDIKRKLRETDTYEKQGDKPAKVDFTPPKSWLDGASTEGRTAPKRTGPSTVSKGSARSTPISPNVVTRKTDPKDRGSQIVRKPEQRHSGPPRAAPPPTFQPRIDTSRSLSMPDWAEVGQAMQHPEARGGAPLSVRVGVDFGTAFTKVAIRTGFDLAIVDWSPVTGDESPVGRWIVPGFVCRGPGGELGWRRFEGEWQGNLKLPLVEDSQDFACPTATLAYLAEVIRYARAFLYRHPEVGRKLANRSLRWELNIGCPTEPHENPQIVERFRHVARAAWWLAGRDDLDEAAIQAAWSRRDLDIGLETEPGVVPEFVAQIAGYLGSHQVSEGLHALIDIGAATLDVATFNVVLPNDLDSSPRIPIFFSAVRPLGTHYLNYNRHSRLGLELAWDDAAPVEPADGFAKRYGSRQNEVDAVDSEFVHRVAGCVTGVIDSTRTNSRGDPRSPVWREGLPIFVTGGGSGCELYRRAIEAGQLDLKRRMGSSSRFRFIELDPLGAKFPQFGTEIGGRLTVAIGLTEDAENIARVVPHRDIEPITRTTRERVDHTELYGDR